jgi:hypothetical protein
MYFEFVEYLMEAANPRTPHPEDAILSGSAAAAQQIAGLKSVISNPRNLTIKWDGKPALIFGRDKDGQLAIMDKYMFDAGFLAKNVEDWKRYDAQKASGNLRGSLYGLLETIWPALNQAVQGPGFYWGDLLYAGQLQPMQGKYVFQPNLVEYRIATNSPLGKIIAGSVGGIVVHQYFDSVGGQPAQWNGNGLANVPGGMAIISPTAGNKFTLKTPVQQERAADAAVKKYGTAVDELLGSVPQSTRDRIKTYFNKFITRQTNEPLHTWLAANVSKVQYNALAGDDYTGKLFAQDPAGEIVESPGYVGLKAIWNSIYAFKQHLAKQLASQVQGIEEYVNGQPAGEGFVFPTASGLVKIVDREVFSAANFAKMN